MRALLLTLCDDSGCPAYCSSSFMAQSFSSILSSFASLKRKPSFVCSKRK